MIKESNVMKIDTDIDEQVRNQGREIVRCYRTDGERVKR